MIARSHLEWYRSDPTYAAVPKEFRCAGADAIPLVWARQPAGIFRRPAADEFTLQLVMSDGVRARVDHGVTFGCRSWIGAIAVAPPGADLEYDNDGELTYMAVVLSLRRLRAIIDVRVGRPWRGDFGDLHARLFDDESCRSLVLRLWEEAASGSPHGALLADSIVDTLSLSLLVRSGEAIPSSPPRGGLAPWQVKRVIEYIEDRLADDVSLDDLSRLLNLSTFHVCRAFRESTGLPPHRWRMQRRVERAREMLELTDLPVTEIAASVGFDDPSGFASAFRKALGVSPSHYRRERRS